MYKLRIILILVENKYFMGTTNLCYGIPQFHNIILIISILLCPVFLLLNYLVMINGVQPTSTQILIWKVY